MTGVELVAIVALAAAVARHRKRHHRRRSRHRLTELIAIMAAGEWARRRRHSRRVSPYPLSPSDFEHYVGHWLEARGFNHVRVLGGPGDLGADIICTDPRHRRTVVQCKRYGRAKVSSGEVQSLIGAKVIHRAELAIIATTGELTEPAWQLARTHGVMVADRRVLALASGPAPR